MQMIKPGESLVYDVLLPKLEVLFVFLSILGAILFWNHWVRNETLFIIGLGGLAEVYFLKAFEPLISTDEVNFPEQYFGNFSNQFSVSENQSFFLNTLAPKVMYISSAVTLVGVLFKLMFWNGSTTLLIAAVPLLVSFIIALALNQRVNRRATMMAIIGGLMLTVSSEALIRQLYSDDPQLLEALANQLRHPNDHAAQQNFRKLMNEYRHRH
ncbi:hypothetical protein [Hymenobacter convexus]|uniref:hypothetical protein n=1 Tax=Hymenobacter sp. CA1UV-4 TaxID=3063782 RepID=UPI00272ADFA6|nr:hypothetical protein [Hymenobacter sp. CA1UV-4]